jgi:hypothetical protein
VKFSHRLPPTAYPRRALISCYTAVQQQITAAFATVHFNEGADVVGAPCRIFLSRQPHPRRQRFGTDLCGRTRQFSYLVARGRRVPALRQVIAIHVFASKTFDIGRDEIDVGDGLSIGLYSPERSIVDVIRLRHREGPHVAWDALRRWLRRRGSKPRRCWQWPSISTEPRRLSETHWKLFCNARNQGDACGTQLPRTALQGRLCC